METIKCPVCNGEGLLMSPIILPKNMKQERIKIAHALRDAKYSIREIMHIMNYKSTLSVTLLLQETPPPSEPSTIPVVDYGKEAASFIIKLDIVSPGTHMYTTQTDSQYSLKYLLERFAEHFIAPKLVHQNSKINPVVDYEKEAEEIWWMANNPLNVFKEKYAAHICARQMSPSDTNGKVKELIDKGEK